jgi:predicted Zn-dependent protease
MRNAWLLTCIVLAWALPVSAAETDPSKLLDSMERELKRNKEQLTLPDYPSPYFISYLMRDVRTTSLASRYGAPVYRRDDRQRVVFSDVRVGSPEFDNTQDPYPGFDFNFMSFDPLKDRAPLSDDDLALRKVLWQSTDAEYKQAVASYLKVKAQRVYQADDPEFTGCFSSAPALRQVDKPAIFDADGARFEKEIVRLSGRLSEIPFIHDSSATFDALRQDRYYVNSEGSATFTSQTWFSMTMTAMARAEDGSVVPHAVVVYARSVEELPDRARLDTMLDELIRELDALRKAPVLPPYNGPTLLEGDTAGVFLHEALGHRLEGHRQAGGEEGGTFRGKVGDPILPEMISVFDDPTQSKFGKLGVNGWYTIDDEGVKAQKVNLVESGRLAGFLLTRRPIEKFRESNGHARGNGTQRPVARMGTLVLTSTKTASEADLKKQLIDLAKQQGKPFAIILRKAASGMTNTSSWGFQAFKGVAKLVYKVDVETGEETLVRGVELVGTPLASLMKVAAVGDTSSIFNGYCGAESGFVPVSTITPSLLMSELEFQKSPPKREQKEVLPPPEP